MPKYRVAEHFTEPILSADPSVTVTRLKPEDEFMILASDGLWEHLSNQEAVDIVHSSPRQVSSTPKSTHIKWDTSLLVQFACKICLLISS